MLVIHTFFETFVLMTKEQINIQLLEEDITGKIKPCVEGDNVLVAEKINKDTDSKINFKDTIEDETGSNI